MLEGSPFLLKTSPFLLEVSGSVLGVSSFLLKSSPFLLEVSGSVLGVSSFLLKVSSFLLEVPGFLLGVSSFLLGVSSSELGLPGFLLGVPGFLLGVSSSELATNLVMAADRFHPPKQITIALPSFWCDFHASRAVRRSIQTTSGENIVAYHPGGIATHRATVQHRSKPGEVKDPSSPNTGGIEGNRTKAQGETASVVNATPIRLGNIAAEAATVEAGTTQKVCPTQVKSSHNTSTTPYTPKEL